MGDFLAPLTATESGGAIASFGSGTGSRNAGARASGRGGRRVAPAGATRSVLGRLRRTAEASQGINTRRARRARALYQDALAQSRRGRGQARLSNAQIQNLRRQLAALGNAINT